MQKIIHNAASDRRRNKCRAMEDRVKKSNTAAKCEQGGEKESGAEAIGSAVSKLNHE